MLSNGTEGGQVNNFISADSPLPRWFKTGYELTENLYILSK